MIVAVAAAVLGMHTHSTMHTGPLPARLGLGRSFNSFTVVGSNPLGPSLHYMPFIGPFFFF